MRTLLMNTDALLRGTGTFAPGDTRLQQTRWALALLVVFAPIYGAAMGSYQFDSAERLWQVVFAAVKVPLLLMATTLLCLPAFFVLNTVLGLREDFVEALRAILSGQAALGITLAALAPLTRFWYFSVGDYRAALLFNAAMFALATLAGHVVMFRFYRVLVRRNANHRLMAVLWLCLFSFVGIQMGWMLRPFVGDPNAEVAFFRAEPFSNAYVVVARLVFGQ